MLGAMTEGVVYQALIRRTEDLLEMGGEPEDIADCPGGHVVPGDLPRGSAASRGCGPPAGG